ncbi:hypothetical protein COO91_03235 [Nostoc flagelliforme CCNUN1]|uniref:Uncharacterized protein n=1 Tax=Nostoc flagelliforme CCNUN1 TaxID=2038116 RepID=A0A2K8SPF4_9NOSO|nr:hypothetical protein COO91_03235 [Nostoc flagelliforme CCNUN1]
MLGTVSWRVIDLRDRVEKLAKPKWMTAGNPSTVRNNWKESRLKFILDSLADWRV